MQDNPSRVGMSVSAHYRRTNFKPNIVRVDDPLIGTYYRVKLQCDVTDSPEICLFMSLEQVTQLAEALTVVTSNDAIMEYAL